MSLRPRSHLAGLLLAVALTLAYLNTFACPFIIDDDSSIVENQSIRTLNPLKAFSPPNDIGQTVSGRPMLNYSMAVNWAVSGGEVWSYHVLNLLIHILAALALAALVRCTLVRMGVPDAGELAFCIALLWGLHPLQTESVTYIAQRAESLCALFMLLTLLCFERAVQAGQEAAPAQPAGPGPGRAGPSGAFPWFVLCVVCALSAVLSKEVAVSLPVLVLLYDRTFVAGSFAAALRRRGILHGLLALGWIVQILLLRSTGWNRGGTIGFGGVGVTPLKYAASQCPALVRYLSLSFWPNPLIVDYGTQWATTLRAILPGALLAAALVGATLWGLVRRPPLGFLGAWLLVILAPSSSFIPGNRQTIAEHRMYLPLAALVVAAVLAARTLLGRRAATAGAVLVAAFAGAFGAATFVRNTEYQSLIGIFTSNVEGAPDNPFAHSNLGHALSLKRRFAEAEVEFKEAVHLKPDYAAAYYNLGTVYDPEGRLHEAVAAYKRSIEINPRLVVAHTNLGNDYSHLGMTDQAIDEYHLALSINPHFAQARYNLGNSLSDLNRLKEAIAEYTQSVADDPDFPLSHNNLGVALDRSGRSAEALAQFLEAARLDPNYTQAHFNLGRYYYLRAGRTQDAIAEFSTALRIDPGFRPARDFLIRIHNEKPAASLPPPPPAPPSPGPSQ